MQRGFQRCRGRKARCGRIRLRRGRERQFRPPQVQRGKAHLTAIGSGEVRARLQPGAAAGVQGKGELRAGEKPGGGNGGGRLCRGGGGSLRHRSFRRRRRGGGKGGGPRVLPAEQGRGEAGVLQLHGQEHIRQPERRLPEHIRQFAERRLDVAQRQGRRRRFRFGRGRKKRQARQGGARHGRRLDTHGAGQGAPVPDQMIFRRRQPDAAPVGGFQPEHEVGGHRAFKPCQAEGKAAVPARQRGIGGFQQPGVSAFGLEGPEACPKKPRQQCEQAEGEQDEATAQPSPGRGPMVPGGRWRCFLRRLPRRAFSEPGHQNDCPMLI